MNRREEDIRQSQEKKKGSDEFKHATSEPITKSGSEGRQLPGEKEGHSVHNVDIYNGVLADSQ